MNSWVSFAQPAGEIVPCRRSSDQFRVGIETNEFPQVTQPVN